MKIGKFTLTKTTGCNFLFDCQVFQFSFNNLFKRKFIASLNFFWKKDNEHVIKNYLLCLLTILFRGFLSWYWCNCDTKFGHRRFRSQIRFANCEIIFTLLRKFNFCAHWSNFWRREGVGTLHTNAPDRAFFFTISLVQKHLFTIISSRNWVRLQTS